jgi:hypothetical protein
MCVQAATVVDSKLRGTLKRVSKTGAEQRMADRLNLGGGLGLSRSQQELKRSQGGGVSAEKMAETLMEGDDVTEKGPSWFDRASVRASMWQITQQPQ